MERTPSIIAILFISSISPLWTERRDGQHIHSPGTSTRYGCPVISHGYVQLLTKYRQTWISALRNFPRVLGFQKTFNAILFRYLASLAPNQESKASKVLATQETPRPIPLAPVKAGRRGAGKGLLRESSARQQPLCVMICLSIQITKFTPCSATLQVL